MYVKKIRELLLIVIIYVDDLIILASHEVVLKLFKGKLEKTLKMSDFRPLEFCFGNGIERNPNVRTITMSQNKYIQEVLKQFKIEACKTIGTPLDVKGSLLKLPDEKSKEVEDDLKASRYNVAVGSLMYAIVVTRANLAFPISMVCQFMEFHRLVFNIEWR